MSLSRTKTWIAGEVLTASDLNTEFNNILTNALSLISPLTGVLDVDGYTLTLDAAGATQVNSSAAVSWNFTSGAKTEPPATSGSVANWSAQTFMDSATAGSGTAAAFVAHAFKRPTLAATNATVTTTNAATVYIENAPAAGANETLTNPLALWIDDGASRFDGAINMFKGADIASATTINLTTATGNLVHVSGSTTITGVTLGSGMMRQVIFDDALTLTHHSTNNNLPTGANITTAAGDRAMYWSDGTTVYCVNYMPAVGYTGLVQNTFTGIQRWAKGADVASANALTLGTDGNYFDITGTTAITSISTLGVGTAVKLHFDGILTLTHQATDLILPGGANITTAAGDEAEFVEYATGDWRCTSYVKASGQPVTQTVLQVIEGTPNATYSSITTAIPYDDSIPQSGEGGEVCTVTITPLSSSNRLVIEAQFFGTSTSTGTVVAVFQDATASAISAGVLTHASDIVVNGGIRYEMAAGTTSATTFKLRAGNNVGATTYVNGSSSGRLLGGVGACRIKVTEIKV